ncbi:vesicle transport protein SEC20 [Hetaerina americana]|uniref:vesicle transport protein SEC20 n=1 Tax=Hetaerina americana TaxID=62018 RepID=UPI003A7F6093
MSYSHEDGIRQEIVSLNLQIKALIQDIKVCHGPAAILNELNGEVRSKLTSLREELEKLELIAKEKDKESDKFELLKQVNSHRQQLTSTLKDFRKANVACQLEIEKKNKELLFEGTQGSTLKKRVKDKEQYVKFSSDVTEHLLSISRQLAETTQRSAHTLENLTNSSTTVLTTRDEFSNMGSLLGQSRKLLTKYGRRECTDKVLVLFAFAFFLACVIYIIKKRIF